MNVSQFRKHLARTNTIVKHDINKIKSFRYQSWWMKSAKPMQSKKAWFVFYLKLLSINSLVLHCVWILRNTDCLSGNFQNENRKPGLRSCKVSKIPPRHRCKQRVSKYYCSHPSLCTAPRGNKCIKFSAKDCENP